MTAAEQEKQFEIIKSIINRQDPFGLLALGCPEDEYDMEIYQISEQLREGTSRKKISEIISRVFYEALNESHAPAEYNDLANEIWLAINHPVAAG